MSRTGGVISIGGDFLHDGDNVTLTKDAVTVLPTASTARLVLDHGHNGVAVLTDIRNSPMAGTADDPGALFLRLYTMKGGFEFVIGMREAQAVRELCEKVLSAAAATALGAEGTGDAG